MNTIEWKEEKNVSAKSTKLRPAEIKKKVSRLSFLGPGNQIRR